MLRRTLIVFLVVGAVLVLPNAVISALRDGPSICHGRPQAGSISNAIPVDGGPARPYCWICTRLLRTYGHETAVAAIAAAYDDVGNSYPATDWVYGESGWPWGGRFWPHRTHRNGLSFDFMVPLAGSQGLPTHPFNLFGYGLDFDSDGRSTAGEIDFAAVVAHLQALDRQARARGGVIGRVIFAPDLQDDLARAPGGAELVGALRFSTKPSWFRHDQHYHVDFDFKCAACSDQVTSSRTPNPSLHRRVPFLPVSAIVPAMEVCGGGSHDEYTDTRRAPHHAERGRPADLDRLRGGGAGHALRIQAAEPRRSFGQSPLFRPECRSAVA